LRNMWIWLNCGSYAVLLNNILNSGESRDKNNILLLAVFMMPSLVAQFAACIAMCGARAWGEGYEG